MTVKLTILSIFLLICAPVTASYAADKNHSFSKAGEASKGRRVFNRCKACHNLTATNRTRLGPNLDALFGKEAGSALNFKFSKALKEAKFIWTENALNEWLKSPKTFLPGNKMQFAGVRREQDRNDLIAYLRQAAVIKTTNK
ncbi:MAG: cytochrome c family protein [Kordiimonadaceae bacterium]|nr:cytochrome c family protein [Kordiimonadaceae bacterium]